MIWGVFDGLGWFGKVWDGFGMVGDGFGMAWDGLGWFWDGFGMVCDLSVTYIVFLPKR